MNSVPRKEVTRVGFMTTPRKPRRNTKTGVSPTTRGDNDKDRCLEAGVPSAVRVEFEVDGMPLRILQVDTVVPHRDDPPGNGPSRMIYVAGEIVHFEFGGHRYALVGDVCEAARSSLPPRRDESAVDDSDILTLLTNRELQIVQLICMGYLTKQVAARLRLSEFTVRSYLKTVYCKLRVRSRAAMVYRYARAFMVPAKDAPPSGGVDFGSRS
jgi:DNA-binding CsgD family transcriptional regulator